jgi:hypothetical protein
MNTLYYLRTRVAKIWAISENFIKLPKVNNRPLDENSPNLITLVAVPPNRFETSVMHDFVCENSDRLSIKA